MRKVIGRVCLLVVLLCSIVASSDVIGAAFQEDTLCFKIAKCTCKIPKGKSHSDSTKSHEPATTDYNDNNVPKFQPHEDVHCSQCNSAGEYYCPVEGKNRK